MSLSLSFPLQKRHTQFRIHTDKYVVYVIFLHNLWVGNRYPTKARLLSCAHPLLFFKSIDEIPRNGVSARAHAKNTEN